MCLLVEALSSCVHLTHLIVWLPCAVAHIKDMGGKWWRFDDETVSEMGAAGSYPADHGSSAAAGEWHPP